MFTSDNNTNQIKPHTRAKQQNMLTGCGYLDYAKGPQKTMLTGHVRAKQLNHDNWQQ